LTTRIGNRGVEMVKAFDEAVFKGPLLKVQGPVKTRFGYHLIETIYRN
ncbi:MAG: peptidylprolyl isomerase, partial [Oceanobacter sp.]